MRQDLNYRNYVYVDGRSVGVEELSGKQSRDLGNQIRRRPLEALGYLAEEKEKSCCNQCNS